MMLTIIFSFLRLHWQIALIVSAILSVFAMLGVQHLEIAHLRHQIALCHSENITLETSNEALLASVAGQNKAIENLQAESQSKTRHAAQLLVAARAKAAKYQQAAKTMMARQSSHDECADLRGLVDGFLSKDTVKQ